MKTRHIVTALFILVFAAPAITRAEGPVTRLTFISQPARIIEFYSIPEKEVDESHFYELFKGIISNQRLKTSGMMLDISAFVIPEEEIDDLDLDTRLIFEEITGLRSSSQ
jgi:hypothetical protein